MIKTAHDVITYRKELKKALRNNFLGATLDNFATGYRTSRANAFSGIDFDALAQEIAAGKDQSIAHLQELLEEFTTQAEKAGVKVHFARTAFEANSIIASIAKASGVKQIVKGKSMTAEETFLNDHLEKEGFEVTETDLGEWIIQLRKEGPSHMVMPAIHLSRKDVAELFTKVTGKPHDPDDINGMVKVARKELRRKFLEADMGISGANFAIAESGAIGLVTNEGNGRLVTTLPRVHVALVGVDKLLPDIKSALRILMALPRNATGQLISTYVTWITGPTECKSSPDSKKEMHIVFLDNGRLALAGDPVFSQALRCIRCGACANVCPIYKLVGGHSYGHVYIGAIGLILTYFYHGRRNARAIVKNCLNCQACKSVCPTGIDLPYLIKEVHRTVLKVEGKKPFKNMLLKKALENRRLFHFLLRRASLAQKPLAEGQYLRHLPFLFSEEHSFRRLPVVAKVPLRDMWQSINRHVENPRYRVALFGGCLSDFVYPEQGQALLRLCLDHDVQLEYPMEQTCCGLPAQMMGERETAKDVAVQNLKAIDPADYDYILTLCASCGSHLKENYRKLLSEEPGLAVKVSQLKDKLIDFSSFMIKVLKVDPDQFRRAGGKVAYHSPCHLCRGQGVTKEPRELLSTAGLEYVPAKDEDVCCGFGGSFSIDFPEISAELLKRKLDNIEAAGVETLVTDCPGCVLQLRGGMEKRGGKIKVKHIAEVVAERKRSPQSRGIVRSRRGHGGKQSV
ncbi:MAG: L-lactate dehydrogenase (quinone) large subunit LdhH [Syntrophobacteraceae bacterium]|jgi:iron-sulfur cluster protein